MTLPMLLAVGFAIASAGPAVACELSEILRARASITESYAAYTEERHVHYVTAPISATGNLRYKSPNRLEMDVVSPKPESFVYQDGILSIGGDSGEKDVAVASEALLSALFTALVGTLSGDEAKLRDKFDVFFADANCDWRMTLVPKQERVRAKVDGIEIAGRNAAIGEILLKMANGDRSLMTIREAE